MQLAEWGIHNPRLVINTCRIDTEKTKFYYDTLLLNNDALAAKYKNSMARAKSQEASAKVDRRCEFARKHLRISMMMMAVPRGLDMGRGSIHTHYIFYEHFYSEMLHMYNERYEKLKLYHKGLPIIYCSQIYSVPRRPVKVHLHDPLGDRYCRSFGFNTTPEDFVFPLSNEQDFKFVPGYTKKRKTIGRKSKWGKLARKSIARKTIGRKR